MKDSLSSELPPRPTTTIKKDRTAIAITVAGAAEATQRYSTDGSILRAQKTQLLPFAPSFFLTLGVLVALYSELTHHFECWRHRVELSFAPCRPRVVAVVWPRWPPRSSQSLPHVRRRANLPSLVIYPRFIAFISLFRLPSRPFFPVFLR